MLYLPAFSESNAWDFQLVMTDISGNAPATSEDFQRITEDFRPLPKIKCPLMFQKTFEHFRSYLKAHMSNTLDQIPVDKTWSPTESSRKMKPEVQ